VERSSAASSTSAWRIDMRRARWSPTTDADDPF
jgi:hypothetical protein